MSQDNRHFAQHIARLLADLADKHPRPGVHLGNYDHAVEHIYRRIEQGCVRSYAGWYVMATPAQVWYSPLAFLAEELAIPWEGVPADPSVVPAFLARWSHDIGLEGRAIAGDVFGALGRSYRKAGWSPLCSMYLKE